MPPKAAAAPPAPLVEYRFNGELWRCNRLDLLAAEVGNGFAAEHLELLQAHISGRERLWLIVRRLFGLQPVLPPKDYPLEDLRPWSSKELASALGLKAAQLQEELEAVRGVWLKLAPPPALALPTPPPAAPPEEFVFADEELFKRHDFGRLRFKDQEEKAYFLKRVMAYEKLLSETNTQGLARNLLLTELQLRRMDEEINRNISGFGAEHRSNLKERRELDKTYTDQIEAINKLAPWAAAVAGKYDFKGQLSDITRAMQEYYGSGDTQLFDGIFTLTEMRCELRRSVQASEPRYRAGTVVYLNAAKAGLLDPHWKPTISARDVKILTESFRAAAIAVSDAEGVQLPDLEKDGPENEYEEIHPSPAPPTGTPA